MAIETELRWKRDWAEAQEHYRAWWQHDGLVLSTWGGLPRETPHEVVPDPGPPQPDTQYFLDADYRAQHCHWRLAQREYPGDTLPIADTMIGPGSLALALGSKPGFTPQTVWYYPTMMEDDEPERRGALTYDPANRWMCLHEKTLRACQALGAGKYLVGIPDLVENVDILSALRDPQHLMMDMVERPEWIEEKVWEINDIWFAVYDRLYEAIKLADDSSAFACFGIWGPGKVAKVQCDAAAMFSPGMFRRFVKPALTAQCKWLDHSLFHLDGTQCLGHLDVLLEIDELDGIEWTPQAGIENGGHPRWYPVYRKILAAGKSVQAICVRPNEVIPLLDAVGGKGMYIYVAAATLDEYERLYDQVAAYR